MATAGSIVVDLLMRTGAFETDTKRAEDIAKKRAAAIDKAFEEMGQKIGLAAVAAGGAIAAMVVSTANAAKEVSNLAQISGAGTEEFQRFAAGAKTVGIEQDKLGDIFKDFREKVGEFVQTGGGGMKDFFEQVAPKVGITAEAFRNLSGPQALQLYVDSLEKAGLSQEQMSFYLESMASDTTALIPLLRDGGHEMVQLGDAAAQAGRVMSEETIKSAQQLSKDMEELNGYMVGIKNEIASAVIPTLTSLSGEFLKVAKDVGIAQASVITFGGIVARALKIDDVGKVQRQIDVVTRQIEESNQRIERAQSSSLPWANSTAKAARADLEEQLNQRARLNEQLKALVAVPAPTADMYGPPVPTGFTKPPAVPWKPPTTGQSGPKVSEAERLLESMQKQLQVARDMTELEKLQTNIQAGRITGLTPAIQTQLTSLAQQLDFAKELEQFDKATLEFLKERQDAENEIAEANKRNQEEFEKAGLAVYEATRTSAEKQMEEIARLNVLLKEGAISADTFNRAMTDVTGGDYWENWLEAAEDAMTSFDELAGNVVKNFSSQFGNAFEQMIFDSQSLGESVSGMVEGMARSVVNALGQMAAQWLAYQLVQMMVGKTTAATAASATALEAQSMAVMAGLNAFASTAAIPVVGPAMAPAAMTAALTVAQPMAMTVAALSASAAAARATGGPVSVDTPYLVGERGAELFVPNTSGAIVPNHKLGGGGITVNLIEDKSRAGQTQERTNNGAQELDVFVADIMGDGARSKALQRAFGLRRKGY